MRMILALALTVSWMCPVAARAETLSLRDATPADGRWDAARIRVLYNGTFNEDPAGGERGSKSTAKAVLYSLLLPGLGQQYLGESHQARIFYAAEVAVWTSFLVFEVQGHLRENGYQEYAQTFAGVASKDHSDDYYKLLTQYDSFREYENEIKSEGRLALYPDVDVETLERYFVDNRVADYEPWLWESAEKRRAYQNRRSASRRAFRRALYAAATGLANRAASAFFAIRSAREINQAQVPGQRGFRIEFGAPRYRPSDGFQTGVSIVRSF